MIDVRTKSEDAKPGPAKKDDANKKTKQQASKDKQKLDDKGANKRRKAFITLSYIVVAYMVCWVPFHFVFDVSLANPLNPFMYAFSSADFRGAVIQMIKCRYCRSQM